MGCTASKLDNEDTVQRCKERCRLMKEAVYARHHLAAAHSDYCQSLRITGSALVTFASGEPLSVSDHTPAVLLRNPTSTTTTNKPPTFIPSPSPSIHPPPPQPPMSTTSSHHYQKPSPPPPRRRRPIKLPHILSDSSFSSSPPPNHNFTYNARANSTYSSTPSQTSSVWNWDNFYPPPSPPDSEYFHKLHNSKKNETQIENNNSDDDHPYSDNDNDDNKASNLTTSFSNIRFQAHQYHNPSNQFDDRASNYSSYSRYSDNTNNNYAKNYTRQTSEATPKKGQKLKSWECEEEEETVREEVQCSEWGDHDNYSSRSSSSDDEDDEGDLKSRSDFGNFESVKNDAASNVGNLNSKFSSKSEKLSSEDDDGKSSVNWGNGNFKGMNSDSRIVVRHKDLTEIVAALREYFDKAASAGEQVSEMLEAGRAQLDRSFKQLRKTIYHSSGMLSNLSSSWTSKPPLAVKYRFEPGSIEQSGGPKSLCSTLERLLAWEKKLYQEVKAREGVKLEHDKKLSALQSQEYRGEDDTKLGKTKASIKRLQSLILVTSQAVSTTSFAIIGLRDADLVPQLVELCHGFMYMWRSMNRFHEIQNDVVQQVRGLVNHATQGESTSDLHRQATRELESAVLAWHSSFCRISFDPSTAGSSSPSSPLTPNRQNAGQLSEVFAFFDEWKLASERIPDTVASEAIKSFNNVIRSISLKQTEELKIKNEPKLFLRSSRKGRLLSGALRRNIISLTLWLALEVLITGLKTGMFWTRGPTGREKGELATCQRRVEEEMIKHSKAVEVTRAMTLNNIQTGLPGVFQAMTSFSALITEALETVCTRSSRFSR
ncbi:hypothetical protein DH2020_023309 [Rehmannia glutinosa]|uniref:Uncharacterized protein n=1 Tax=Rehmannia glutinosa TaxID=99300 RepID=A0ABR0W886_REHGL